MGKPNISDMLDNRLPEDSTLGLGTKPYQNSHVLARVATKILRNEISRNFHFVISRHFLHNFAKFREAKFRETSFATKFREISFRETSFATKFREIRKIPNLVYVSGNKQGRTRKPQTFILF